MILGRIYLASAETSKFPLFHGSLLISSVIFCFNSLPKLV